ncbi:MAG: endonuclease V [Gemmataceae bacterium]
MIAALDVQYCDSESSAHAAAIVFENWNTEKSYREYRTRCEGIAAYVPGHFFQRELPCLLAILNQVQEPIDVIVIDGYVTLGDRPGLGIHLWESLNRKTPIVGVAKTRYHSSTAVEVCRGESRSPLFITTVGMDPIEAAAKITAMAGTYRIPDLLKAADQLARNNGIVQQESRSRPA